MTHSLSGYEEIALLPGLSACLAVLVVLVLVAVVVLPAVWSRDAERRHAALTVLRLLLRHWSEHRSRKAGRRPRQGIRS
ncbi:hypothetical protein NE236_04560 [Actinoallomurus purpureus]|uniref:hypothetical protein n=1 Tax=Actinoallomurus purpureus TaxID=478114 RepID=UPI0020937149|nr:hypothetical protein [Actinoallomurus purpureus]MCO6004244.1 hypothetical protein [Actinoallomurus purpureus]